jgi:hypothetical protein
MIVTKHLAASRLGSLVFFEVGTRRYDCRNRDPACERAGPDREPGFLVPEISSLPPQDCGCQFGYHTGATPCFRVNLSAIGSLAEYCAAQKMKSYVAVSVILTGLWLLMGMNGFN